ncbi:hypothetical protein BS50DRAFT_632185 [Corynespora cassiicola Philippines]|uniref:Uncharacterized protein n=1 Tax=Corynespora cassiicola Philippines TaxID=1448308 RepID=A0A2T2NXX9_CORCC|nr:hypothetical protein BS50DRAFT_632185 [Corynespora cassiicola Philippines]
MDTISGAATQDYPSTRFRVFVLDDFKDGKLEKAIRDYNRAHGTSVYYLARTKLPDESHFYKAGNLRFGLTTTENMGDGSVYFASLDVDMIPERDWLRRLIPHLILDDGMALVCPAQWHYNLPDPDLLGQAGHASMEIFEPMYDNIGCSHCFGSGYIVRRSALEQIGGWPKVPVGEDIFCSYMLAGHGWGIAFIKEFVQYGLTAGSFEALSKQRMRWADGDQLLMKGINFFNPARDPAPRRTVPQRLYAILKILRGYTVPTDCIAMVLLPVTLWIASHHSGEATQKGPTEGGGTLRLLLLATILADKLSYCMIHWKIGRQTESRFWAAPWTMARMVYLMLPKAIVSFTATGTVKSAVNERDARRRKGITSRLLSPVMTAYMGYTVAALVSLASVLVHGMGKEVQGMGAAVRLVEYIFKVSVPLRYMAFPPTVAERRDLMEEGELGVYRPKNKYKLKVSRRVTWLDVAEVATILVLGWC